MPGPLAGIRVLDASMGAVGPWAGVLLGQLGADVIKLESPQGDFIRVVMPAKRGLGTTYISMNFNKSGLVLDLKKPEDRAKAHELAAQADVFIENFRPGVADRIGVGYAELSRHNPRLIYASASGFGPKGPMVKIGATDPHLQPFTGSCSVNGEAGGKMQSWRWYGHFDCTTAMCITEGILSALLERETTGRGALLEGRRTTGPLRTWARHLPAVRDRTVLESHAERWLSGFSASPVGVAAASLPGSLLRELRPAPGETVGVKLSRSRLAVSNALVARSRHVEEVERAGIRAPLFYELEHLGADATDAVPGADESTDHD